MIRSRLVLAAPSATPVFDGSQGDVFELQLTQNGVLTVQNLVPGRMYVFDIRQDGIGGRSLTYPSNVLLAALPHAAPNSRVAQVFVCGQDRRLYPASAGTFSTG